MHLKHYLLLGATGFIGTVLGEVLSRDKKCLVDLVVRTRTRLGSWAARDNVRVIVRPEWTTSALEEAVGLKAYDAVFHLAGAGVDPGARELDTLIEANVAVTSRLVRALRTPTRFIYAGTCAEYGRVQAGRWVLETDPVAPVELYGASKAAASVLGRSLAKARGIDFVHARLFGVYGVGEPNYRLIPSLLSTLKRGQPLELTPGAQTRDFMFAEDCARAFMALAETEELEYDTYNICTGHPLKVADIAQAVCEIAGASSSQLLLGAKPYRNGESMWMVGDSLRLREGTGFEPEVSLLDGIERILYSLRG